MSLPVAAAYTLAVIHLVSWNIAHKRALWAWLHDLDAGVALLQEAGTPGPEWALAVGRGSRRQMGNRPGWGPWSVADSGCPPNRPGGVASATRFDIGYRNVG